MTDLEIFRNELNLQKQSLVLALHRVDTMLTCLDIGAEKISEMKRKELNKTEADEAAKKFFRGQNNVRKDDEVSIDTMFDEIEDMVLDFPEFNQSFLESLRAQWDAKNSLSPKQVTALKNIYNGLKKGKRS